MGLIYWNLPCLQRFLFKVHEYTGVILERDKPIFCQISSVSQQCFNSSTIETKIAQFANSVDLDEVAHNEPPHLDLHCLPSSL